MQIVIKSKLKDGEKWVGPLIAMILLQRSCFIQSKAKYVVFPQEKKKIK